MHVNLGGYHIRDIEFVAAFDVDKNKVGKDLSEAIYTKPNNTYVFQQVQQPRRQGRAGHDPRRPRQVPQPDHREGARPTADVVGILKERKVDVMVSYLPVGSEEATKWYVEQALRPASASSTRSRCSSAVSRTGSAASPRRACRHRRRHQEPGRRDDQPPRPDPPVHGPRRPARSDVPAELRRQHRLPEHARAGAPRVEEDHEDQRRHLDARLRARPDDVHVGPSDHVPWLLDRKWCYIRMEGTTYGDVPLNAELKLEVWDSPNSAGVITDAIRCLKLGLDRGLKARSWPRRATS
jgi:myo-inositol-1-phosphate synthase